MTNRNRKLVKNTPYSNQTTKIEGQKKKKTFKVICGVCVAIIIASLLPNCKGCSSDQLPNKDQEKENDYDDHQEIEDNEAEIENLANTIIEMLDVDLDELIKKANIDLPNDLDQAILFGEQPIVELEQKEEETVSKDSNKNPNQTNHSSLEQPEESKQPEQPEESDTIEQPSQPTQPDQPSQPSQPSQPTQPDQPNQPSQPEQPTTPDKIDGGTSDGDSQTDVGSGETDEIVFPSESDTIEPPNIQYTPDEMQDNMQSPVMNSSVSDGNISRISQEKNVLNELKMLCCQFQNDHTTYGNTTVDSIGIVKSYHI